MTTQKWGTSPTPLACCDTIAAIDQRRSWGRVPLHKKIKPWKPRDYVLASVGTTRRTQTHYLEKVGNAMNSIHEDSCVFNSSPEDNTPLYTPNQPLWLDNRRHAIFLCYGVSRSPSGLDSPYAKIRVFLATGWNDSETSYIDYVDISLISPRTSNGKEVM